MWIKSLKKSGRINCQWAHSAFIFYDVARSTSQVKMWQSNVQHKKAYCIVHCKVMSIRACLWREWSLYTASKRTIFQKQSSSAMWVRGGRPHWRRGLIPKTNFKRRKYIIGLFILTVSNACDLYWKAKETPAIFEIAFGWRMGGGRAARATLAQRKYTKCFRLLLTTEGKGRLF